MIANELLEAILRHGFSARQIKVLMSLIRKIYGFKKKSDDISASQIGEICALARNHVTEALNDLAAMKVITKDIGEYGSKISINKNYSKWISPETGLLKASPESGLLLVPNRETASPKSGVSIVPNQDTQKKTLTKENLTKENLKRCASQAMRESFDKFYSAYPKKRNRKDAEKAFEKLSPNESLLAQILEAVEVAKRCDDWRKEGGKFIPYPASWLNAQGWNDEYPLPEYSSMEMSVMGCYAEIMKAPWPTVVVSPYSASRASAIREFVNFSPAKQDMPKRYFEHCMRTVSPREGCGFDWLIKRETYLSVREGAVKSREAA